MNLVIPPASHVQLRELVHVLLATMINSYQLIPVLHPVQLINLEIQLIEFVKIVIVLA